MHLVGRLYYYIMVDCMYQRCEEKNYIHFCRNISKDCLRVGVWGGVGGTKMYLLGLSSVGWMNLAQGRVQ